MAFHLVQSENLSPYRIQSYLSFISSHCSYTAHSTPVILASKEMPGTFLPSAFVLSAAPSHKVRPLFMHMRSQLILINAQMLLSQ